MDFSGPDLIGTDPWSFDHMYGGLDQSAVRYPLTCQEGRFQFWKVQTYTKLSVNSSIGLEHRDISRYFEFTEGQVLKIHHHGDSSIAPETAGSVIITPRHGPDIAEPVLRFQISSNSIPIIKTRCSSLRRKSVILSKRARNTSE